MRKIVISAAVLVAVPMLVASEANAQQVYSMFGRLISTRGEFIKIPVANGAGNCNNLKAGFYRDLAGPKASPMTFTKLGATMNKLLKPKATAPNTPSGAPPYIVNAPYGCVKGSGMITATAKGVGKRFTIPKAKTTVKSSKGATISFKGAFFQRPLPGHTIAVEIPNTDKFPQLATSFRIDGPPDAIPLAGADKAGGKLLKTKAGVPTNLAPLRKFMKSAWNGGPAMTFNGQTGRAGPNFTWCFGKSDCTNVGQGNPTAPGGIPPQGNLVVKYRGGPNRFGGTMAYVINANGPGKSNLALEVVPGAPIVLLRLAGMGHQPTGRGYASFQTDAVKTGPIWNKWMTGSVFVPEVGKKMKLITTVMTRMGGTLFGNTGVVTALTNNNYGFPFTTGTVLARATGSTAGKGPGTSTRTGKGSDRTVPDLKGPGNGRILTLVAGQMARTTEGSNTPGYVFMPEPSNTLAMFAGALALAGLGLWRARRRQ
jgi:MYXO-CTERM domain-containing protein